MTDQKTTSSPALDMMARLEENRPQAMELLEKQGAERDAKEAARVEAAKAQDDAPKTAAPKADKTTDGATASSGESTSQEQKQPAEKSDPRLEKARNLANLDGLPAGVVDRMSEDELLAYADKARERRSSADAALRERKERIQELERKLEGHSVEGAQTEEPKEPAQEASQPFDLEAAVKPFELEFGPEAAGVLRQIQEASNQRLAALEQRFADGEKARIDTKLDEARRELVERFDGLSTEEGQGSWRDRMKTLGKTGDYGPDDLGKLAEDAALLAFGAPAQASSQAPIDDDSRDRGTVTVDRSDPPARAKTPAEKNKALFEIIASGKHDGDTLKARRMAGLD